MHYTVKKAFDRWHAGVCPADASQFKLAYLGSYDMNGTIGVPCMGFDIVSGPGVDVVMPGLFVPAEHMGVYDSVASISSFQFCPHPDLYLGEAFDLLKPGGELFLTMCGWHCRGQHSTSSERFDDSLRLSPSGLTRMLTRADFEVLSLDVEGQHGHEDIIVTAKKKTR